MDPNQLIGPGNDDYGRYKPFSPPDLTPEQLESLHKSLAEATVTSMAAKPLSANAELFKLLHDEDECHPGIICLDEMVRLHEEEVDSWRSKVVWGFHEDAYPQYIQGKAGENEITSELTADEANGLVKRILTLEAELDNISSAIGSDEFMDPPDGGSVTLAEQIKRMREALNSERSRTHALDRGFDVAMEMQIEANDAASASRIEMREELDKAQARIDELEREKAILNVGELEDGLAEAIKALETARLDARASAACNKAACKARDKALVERDNIVDLLRESRPYFSTWDKRHEECESCAERGMEHAAECITVRVDAELSKHPIQEVP